MEIGAFRTYPADYTPPNAAASEYQPIPLEKIEDFGVHADRYYALDLSIFKTSLDSSLINLLWHKYWVNTLAASPLLNNKAFIGGQLSDISVLPPHACSALCLRVGSHVAVAYRIQAPQSLYAHHLAKHLAHVWLVHVLLRPAKMLLGSQTRDLCSSEARQGKLLDGDAAGQRAQSEQAE